MKGLSSKIQAAIDTILDGMEYELNIDQDASITDDKMKSIVDSKITSFDLAKSMLHKWVGSENAPGDKKLQLYVTKLVTAGEKSLGFLNEALAHDIDYEEIDPHQFAAAMKAKPVILDGIFKLDSSIRELQLQMDSGNINLSDKEFTIGYPEKYAKGEFYPKKNYHKNWLENETVNICPFSTKGKIITLHNLKIRLPKIPKDKTTILYHDLPKKEQYWRRQEVPKNITPDNVKAYDEYIREEFRRRREGIWFMNNGKPVYLTGNAYWALQWCKMLDDGVYMAFREAQLNMFYHLEACIVDKRCWGQDFLKSRRTGFTYIILSIILNAATSTKNGLFGMTSKTGTDVEEAFEKLSYMYLNLPFYFRPVVKNKEDSLKSIEFAKPSDNSKQAKKSRDTATDDYLNTKMDWRTTRNGSYDSVKLNMYLGDENKKWEKPNNYVTHLGMIRPTMVPSGKVVGKAFIGSTSGSMAKGGEEGKKIFYASDVTKRDKVTGKTDTGLYSYFLAAQDNMELFTDIYGKCWTEKPKGKVYNVLGDLITMGSNDYLDAEEEKAGRISDKALNEQLRTYPRKIEDAFRDESGNTIFNITKIYDQIAYNDTKAEEELFAVGNFDWEGGIKDSKVVFNHNPNGRFKVAWLPSVADDTQGLQNRVKKVNDRWFPMNKELGVIGCDPFSLKSTHGKGSKGGIHGITYKIPMGGAPGNKWMFEYVARPTDETIFFEDVIKVCRFYGVKILVESNRIDLLRHMYNRGYRPFAMNRIDRPTHKLNENEKKYGGQVMSGADILDSHMNAIGSWIEDYVGRSTKEEVRPLEEIGDMPFPETLKDWLGFNPDKRTEYDATISSGLALMAQNKEKYMPKAKPKDPIKLKSLIKTYSDRGNIGEHFRSKYPH